MVINLLMKMWSILAAKFKVGDITINQKHSVNNKILWQNIIIVADPETGYEVELFGAVKDQNGDQKFSYNDKERIDYYESDFELDKVWLFNKEMSEIINESI